MNNFYMTFPTAYGWAIGYSVDGELIRVVEATTRKEIVRIFDRYFSR